MARPFDHIEPKLKRIGVPAAEAKAEALFIHGAWSGAWYWEDLPARVAQEGFGVNLLELPGHGEESWNLPGSVGLNDYAMFAAKAAAKLKRPFLVGHSMGGWLVQKILELADLPAVFLAPLPGGGLPFAGLWRLMSEYPAKMAGVFLGRPLALDSPAMVRRFCFDRLPQNKLEAFTKRLTPEPARAALDMGLGLARARPALGRAPRLVLAGGRDALMPVPSLRSLAQRLDARLIVFPDLPHCLWLEDGEGRVVFEILELFDQALSD